MLRLHIKYKKKLLKSLFSTENWNIISPQENDILVDYQRVKIVEKLEKTYKKFNVIGYISFDDNL